MKLYPFALLITGTLLAACGGEPAAQGDAAATTPAEVAAGPAMSAPTAAGATGTDAAAPTQTADGSRVYAPGELLPGGAVDVLQREGFRGPAA